MEKLKNIFSSSPDLSIRAFSSIFVVTAIIGGILAGGTVWAIVVFIAAMLSLWEFCKLLSTKHDISPWLTMAAGAFILLGSSLDMSLTSILGIAYVILPWSFMIIIRTRELGAMFLITLFFCTWSCDVAAYFVGSNLGRNLLCEKVSPKKTWEGFIGGAAASFLCGGILALIFSFPPVPLLLMGLLCGIAGQLGDLGESVLKREAGVKDTGSIIPGHGGLLDRFDSILVNATLAFLIFEIIG